MVWLERGVKALLDENVDSEISRQVKMYAELYTPQISGRLVHSIRVVKITDGQWRVSTHAYGDNGTEYAAHIEKGQAVHATVKKALHFRIRGQEVFAKSVKGSKKAGFMKKTKNSIHI